MTKRNAVLWLVVVAALVAVVVVFRNKVQFDWAMFMQQLRFVSVGHVVAGILLIYLAYRCAGGAVECVSGADEEGVGGIAGGVAIYRVCGGGFVWTAGGFDAALSGGAACGACR